MRSIYFLLIAGTLLFSWGCSQSKNRPSSVTVSILPQKYIVDRISGGKLHVAVMIPPGHSPATYEPTTKQLQTISNSPIYLRIGHIAFEKTEMPKFASINPSMKIADTSAGVKLISTDGENHHGHDHRGIDTHLWLSPRAVKQVARNCAVALSDIFPDKKEIFSNNLAILLRDIDDLDNKITQILKNKQNSKFLVFHPAWGYFARDYSLHQIAIETEGKEPNPEHIRKIIDIARRNNIRTIFIQKQFPTRWAESIARDINGKVVKLDPLAPDWLKNMYKIADAFSNELK